MEGNKKYEVFKKDLLYPELSFEVNGVLFEVFKQMGGGHSEKYYQKGVAAGLRQKKIESKEQFYVPLKCFGENVGKYYLDFLIENKIVLELKRGKFIPVKVIDQVKQYLETLNLQLAIVACFTTDGVVIKRIVNLR